MEEDSYVYLAIFGLILPGPTDHSLAIAQTNLLLKF